jgi:hypothetical protein
MHSSLESQSSTVASSILPPVETKPGRVTRINPLQEGGWDKMLMACPAASFFHTAAWARTLQNTYDYTPVYFTLREAGRLRSLLPVMEVDSWLTGRRGISLPFTDDCEPLCSDFEAMHDVLEDVMGYGKERGWKYLECRGGKSLFADAPASTAFYAHQLPLTGNEGALFAKVESGVRRAIRKAEKCSVSVECSQSLDAVRIFYDLLCKTRKRHGVPPQPYRFFQNIHRHVLSQNMGFIVLAKHQQVPVAAAVYFHWGKKAIYKYGASDETFQHLRANNLVMWEAIKWFSQQGFDQLHFGRTSLTNDGLRRFKLGWNTEETMIEYVRYDWRERGFVTAKDESSGWHNRFFNKLPASLSRLIGAMLYKHVA